VSSGETNMHAWKNLRTKMLKTTINSTIDQLKTVFAVIRIFSAYRSDCRWITSIEITKRPTITVAIGVNLLK
jgi:hypothetical protein